MDEASASVLAKVNNFLERVEQRIADTLHRYRHYLYLSVLFYGGLTAAAHYWHGRLVHGVGAGWIALVGYGYLMAVIAVLFAAFYIASRDLSGYIFWGVWANVFAWGWPFAAMYTISTYFADYKTAPLDYALYLFAWVLGGLFAIGPGGYLYLDRLRMKESTKPNPHEATPICRGLAVLGVWAGIIGLFTYFACSLFWADTDPLPVLFKESFGASRYDLFMLGTYGTRILAIAFVGLVLVPPTVTYRRRRAPLQPIVKEGVMQPTEHMRPALLALRGQVHGLPVVPVKPLEYEGWFQEVIKRLELRSQRKTTSASLAVLKEAHELYKVWLEIEETKIRIARSSIELAAVTERDDELETLKRARAIKSEELEIAKIDAEMRKIGAQAPPGRTQPANRADEVRRRVREEVERRIRAQASRDETVNELATQNPSVPKKDIEDAFDDVMAHERAGRP